MRMTQEVSHQRPLLRGRRFAAAEGFFGLLVKQGGLMGVPGGKVKDPQLFYASLPRE